MSARRSPAPYAQFARWAAVPALMLGTALLLVAGLWLWVQRQAGDVLTLQVEGRLRYVVPGDVQVVVKPHLQAGFFELDLHAVHAAVLGLPWVERAEVRRRWPNGVVVRIWERQPLARWGETALISTTGERFAPAAGTLPVGLPALSGPEGTERLLVESLRHFTDVLAPAGLKVAAITIDARGAWTVTLDIGLVMRLGRDRIEERLRRFADTAVPTLGDRIGQVAYVDLRYGNGFAVRWREQAPVPGVEEG
ncbi:MAG TPA: cell division protein FtsQ/DivIB [Nevskiales bacterium]|nr:cell division protein FtsQ/DivIB [Nevskiales bacterium]